MNKPLISVIIPFYNAELFLQRALESVTNQSYSNIEIVLIDDGSTDASAKIAINFCKKEHVCTLISTKNAGPGSARNLGLKKSIGEFVVFLDADDELLPTAIQRMYNLMNTNIDLCVCMNTMFDSNHIKIKTSKWKNKVTISSNKAIELLVDKKLIPTVWGKIFKTKIAKKCTFPNKSWKEDDVFMLQYLALCNQITIINESLIKIHCRNNSLTRQTISSQMIEDIAYSYQKQHQLISNKKELTSKLIESQVNTFLNLFLILKIDWKSIKNKKNVLKKFQNEIERLDYQSKNQSISLKKRIVLKLFKITKKIGFGIPFGIISLFKYKQIKQLKKVKY